MGLALALLLFAPVCLARESCTQIWLKDDYKRASAVFLGEVNPDGTLRVIQAWKGPKAGENVAVSTAQFQRRLEPGSTYLIFAYRDPADGRLALHDCSHTNPVAADFARQEIATIRSRHRWWDCPLSSITWRQRPGPP